MKFSTKVQWTNIKSPCLPKGESGRKNCTAVSDPSCLENVCSRLQDLTLQGFQIWIWYTPKNWAIKLKLTADPSQIFINSPSFGGFSQNRPEIQVSKFWLDGTEMSMNMLSFLDLFGLKQKSRICLLKLAAHWRLMGFYLQFHGKLDFFPKF